MRPKSVVLSKSEAKAAVKDLKVKIKETEAAIKAVAKDRTAAEKELTAKIKGWDKAVASTNKLLEGYKAQLATLQTPANAAA